MVAARGKWPAAAPVPPDCLTLVIAAHDVPPVPPEQSVARTGEAVDMVWAYGYDGVCSYTHYRDPRGSPRTGVAVGVVVTMVRVPPWAKPGAKFQVFLDHTKGD